MSKRRPDDDFYASSRGRRRGEYKNPEEKLAEEKAKGHLRQPATEVLADEFQGTELHGDEHSRGIQHGYGKNQGIEPVDRKTPFANHSVGGFDHWNHSVDGSKSNR
jgi:hypothetical protein